MVARLCGCASAQCNCVVQAGDGIDVTGTGSPANPYTISRVDEPLTGRLLVQDTPTVDLTLNGEGTLNNPWVLSADTELELGQLTDVDTSNTTTGYVLGRNAGGTFEMFPAPTAPPGTIISDDSIDGDGSIGDPLSVHDYDRIAWLTGADNLPNVGQLRLGLTSSTADNAFYVSREVTSSVPGAGGSVAVPVESKLYTRTNVVGGRSQSGVGLDVDNQGQNIQSSWRFTDRGVVQKQLAHPTAGNISATWQDPWRMHMQSVSVPGNGTSQGQLTLFIPNIFTEPPLVFATHASTATPAGNYLARARAISTTTIQVVLYRVDGNFTTAQPVSLLMAQFNPPTGA